MTSFLYSLEFLYFLGLPKRFPWNIWDIVGQVFEIIRHWIARLDVYHVYGRGMTSLYFCMGHTFDATWRQDASTDFAVWDAFNDPSDTTCKIWCYLLYRWPRYYTLTRHTDTRIQTDRQDHLNTSQPPLGRGNYNCDNSPKRVNILYIPKILMYFSVLFSKCSWRHCCYITNVLCYQQHYQ